MKTLLFCPSQANTWFSRAPPAQAAAFAAFSHLLFWLSSLLQHSWYAGIKNKSMLGKAWSSAWLPVKHTTPWERELTFKSCVALGLEKLRALSVWRFSRILVIYNNSWRLCVSSLLSYFPKPPANDLCHIWWCLEYRCSSGAVLMSCQGVGDILHLSVRDFVTFVEMFCKSFSSF